MSPHAGPTWQHANVGGVGSGVGSAQPPVVHASQQLSYTPTHADPPLGAAHLAVFLSMLHLVAPTLFVRQQVTAPGRPHTDFFAHVFTTRRHADVSAGLASMRSPTQRM